MSNTYTRYRKVMEFLENNSNDWFDTAEEYSEPGYTKDGDLPIVMGDWNCKQTWKNREAGLPPSKRETIDSRAGRILEKLGATLEWCDEWSTCSECYNAVRTQPDSYSWTPYYHLSHDCELTCGDCIKEHPEDYLEELEDNPDRALTIDLDMGELGWVELDIDFESGWYGRNDSPHKIADEIREHNIYRFIFEKATYQFCTRFTVWVNAEELSKAKLTVDEDYDDDMLNLLIKAQQEITNKKGN